MKVVMKHGDQGAESGGHVIKQNWDVVDNLQRWEDRTTRVMGMKFPKEGYK